MRVSHNVVGEAMTVGKLSPRTVCKKSSENRWEAGRTPEFKKKRLEDGKNPFTMYTYNKSPRRAL